MNTKTSAQSSRLSKRASGPVIQPRKRLHKMKSGVKPKKQYRFAEAP
jgi:hypothetical protein